MLKQRYQYKTYSLSLIAIRTFLFLRELYRKTLSKYFSVPTLLRSAGYNFEIVKDLIEFNMANGQELLKNIHYVRYVEYALCVQKLEICRGMLLLDVGSGGSILPSYLIYKGATVYSTDIDNYVLCQMDMCRNNKLIADSDLSRLKIDIQDIKKTNYPDNYFDRIVLLSTIEHITADGDKVAMKEVARILKKAGRAFITFDAARDAHELIYQAPRYLGFRIEGIKRIIEDIEKDETRRVQIDFKVLKNGFSPGYTRFYNEATMMERLVKPSGLKLVEHGFYGDHMFVLRAFFDRKRFVEYLYWLQPILALLLYRKYNSGLALNKKPGAIGYCVLEK